MPPKKASTGTPKKAAASAPSHASYIDMVKDAVIKLKERNGSSRQAIQKYIKANNSVENLTDTMFKSLVNRAIASGEEKGDFTRPKGASGTVKLAKKEAKPVAAAAKKEKVEPKVEKKTVEKKAAPAKKAAAPKKATATKAKATTTAAATKKAPAPKKAAAPKKTTATKAAPKKEVAPKKEAAPKKAPAAPKAPVGRPKANAGRPRKTAAPAAAPAVEAEVSRVLGKTKSGRVTKTTTPKTAAKATPQKKDAAPKKAAASKKATPKKTATPKRTPKKAQA